MSFKSSDLSDGGKGRSLTMQSGSAPGKFYNVESLGIMQVGKDATTVRTLLQFSQ